MAEPVCEECGSPDWVVDNDCQECGGMSFEAALAEVRKMR